ncbi:hypothetical protein C2G38_2194629 [Gigaspora rosea]|uniref:Uncharacterized protein n=1 Tax=Gigaspora rosea TaxID=44941 RepID=A0A397UY00_9GLOM|nr:hypothetical protein C2G38_2194629 [Gigaspora rosea]
MSIKTNNVFVNNCLPSKQVKQRDKQNYSLKATEFASQSRNDDKGIGKDRIIAIIGTISAVIIASAVVVKKKFRESKEQVEALIEKNNEQIKQLPQTSLSTQQPQSDNNFPTSLVVVVGGRLVVAIGLAVLLHNKKS